MVSRTVKQYSTGGRGSGKLTEFNGAKKNGTENRSAEL
jgi:hypothetical protein